VSDQHEEESLRRAAREQAEIERQTDAIVLRTLTAMVTAAEDLKSKLRRDTDEILENYRRSKRSLENDIGMATAERQRLRREAEDERDGLLERARETADQIVAEAEREREALLTEVRAMEHRLRALDDQIRAALGLGAGDGGVTGAAVAPSPAFRTAAPESEADEEAAPAFVPNFPAAIVEPDPALLVPEPDEAPEPARPVPVSAGDDGVANIAPAVEPDEPAEAPALASASSAPASPAPAAAAGVAAEPESEMDFDPDSEPAFLSHLDSPTTPLPAAMPDAEEATPEPVPAQSPASQAPRPTPASSPPAAPAPAPVPASPPAARRAPAQPRLVRLIFEGVPGYQQAAAVEQAVNDLVPDGDLDIEEFEQGTLVLNVTIADLPSLAEKLAASSPTIELKSTADDRAMFRYT